MADELGELVRMTRNDKKASMTAGEVAAFAQGVVMKHDARVLKENGGNVVVTREWGRRYLKKNNFQPRAKTSDRTVSAAHALSVAGDFYASIQETLVEPEFLFNVDEYHALLAEGADGWTWQHASQAKRVAVRKVRVGLTMAALSCAGGELEQVQCIWQGKTDAVHVQGVSEPKIYQCHQPGSHFQNVVTWNAWLVDAFVPLVRAKRAGRAPADTPVCLIADAAGQHACTPETLELLEDEEVYLRRVPAQCTHIFQPADMLVLRNLKVAMSTAWKKYIAQTVAASSGGDAIERLYTTSLPQLRRVKVELLRQALQQDHTGSVCRSWDMSGIIRTVYSGVPRCPVVLDEFKDLAKIESGSADNPVDVDDGEGSDMADDVCPTTPSMTATPSQTATPATLSTPATQSVIGLDLDLDVDELDVSSLVAPSRPAPAVVPEEFTQKPRNLKRAAAEDRAPKRPRMSDSHPGYVLVAKRGRPTKASLPWLQVEERKLKHRTKVAKSRARRAAREKQRAQDGVPQPGSLQKWLGIRAPPSGPVSLMDVD
eukprot:TRINITY_DN12001_c0_g1_i1.p1 TRINITY_DN12001_c0_g1~~TRINITY_DN12001_c0_g1_i1.p1  ORF type:complete len:605 (-),score=167.86 TRINITY_DN12001_c0_g1_i1:582-2207(-)